MLLAPFLDVRGGGSDENLNGGFAIFKFSRLLSREFRSMETGHLTSSQLCAERDL